MRSFYLPGETHDLFTQLQDMPHDIQNQGNAGQSLRILGYKTPLVAPAPDEMLESVYNSEKYRYCRALMDISREPKASRGQILKQAARSIIGDDNYGLKFSGEKRCQYNRRVDDLAIVVPEANKMRARWVLDKAEPEGAFFAYGSLAGLATFGTIAYLTGNEFLHNYAWQISLACGTAIGALTSLIAYNRNKLDVEKLHEQISFVNQALGLEQPTDNASGESVEK